MTTPFIGLEGAVADISTEVSAVEEVLKQELRSEVETVEQIGLHTLEAGGKRLRPALVVVSARATGRPFDVDRARRLGACLEMIHMATLIHDDVIDHSPTRRGRPTASAVFGNTASILSGDVLLAKAMAILAEDGDLEIIRAVSGAVVKLAQGEVRELEVRGNVHLSEEEHFSILNLKTASLISCCCEVGARVANATDEEREALCSYGYHLGIAFQIVDDLLDYRGNSSDTGKAIATDYVEGCATLPLIRLIPMLNPEDRSKITEWFGSEAEATTKENLEHLVSLMEALGVFKQVDKTARDHIDCGQAALQLLPDSPHRNLLNTVGRFVVERNR